MNKFTVIAVAIGLSASVARAEVTSSQKEDWTVGLHLTTYHFGAEDTSHLNSNNLGLYVKSPSGFTFGTYRNSHDHQSAYAGWTWQTSGESWAAAMTVGLVQGYRGNDGRNLILPLIAPSIRTPVYKDFALRFTLLPKPPEHGNAWGIHLSLEHRF